MVVWPEGEKYFKVGGGNRTPLSLNLASGWVGELGQGMVGECFPSPRQSLWFYRPKAGLLPSPSSLREQGLKDVMAIMRGNGSQLGVTVPLTARMGADKLVRITLGSVQKLSYQPWSGGT